MENNKSLEVNHLSQKERQYEKHLRTNNRFQEILQTLIHLMKLSIHSQLQGHLLHLQNQVL